MLPLHDEKRSGSFPFWVLVIISINLYVFYLELTSSNPDELINNYALIPAMVNFFDPYTLLPFITSQFLHGGFLHIISNLWFLWIFGDNVEERLGFVLFPFFYLLFGIIGNSLQYIFSLGSTIPLLGASGAIAGVLGFYYALFPRHRIKTLVFILVFVTIVEIPAYIMLFYWFITQLFSSAASVSPASAALGGIAYFAHVGGFISGWFIGRFFFAQKSFMRV